MWRSQSDLLLMAQEHNRDLVRQADADRLNRHLNGTLASRLKAWWMTKAPALAIRRWFPENTEEMANTREEYPGQNKNYCPGRLETPL